MNIADLDRNQTVAVLLNVEIRAALENLHCERPEFLSDPIMKQINIAIRNVSYGLLQIMDAASNGHRAAAEYLVGAAKGIEPFWEAPEVIRDHERVLAKSRDDAWIE